MAAEEDGPARTWHQGTISGVAGENPAFEPSARLAKRWLAAHLLSPHLSEEATELLLAAAFTAPTAPPPGSRLSGLLRFLQLLSEHPWRVQPLIVDPSGDLSAAQRDAVVRQHGSRCADGSAPALCIATPKDPTGGSWTGGQPSSQVLHRIVVLAQRSAAALEQLLLGGGAAGAAAEAAGAAAAGSSGGDESAVKAALATVFSRDLSEYDVLIRLRPDALPNGGNDLRLGGASSAGASSTAAAGRPPLGPALAAANQQLAAAAEAAGGDKHSRAILKGIPHSELPVVCSSWLFGGGAALCCTAVQP